MTEQLGPDPLEDTRLPELASIERLCNAACDLERAIAAKAKRILTSVTCAYAPGSPESKKEDASIFNAYWRLEVELLPLRPFGGYFKANHFECLGTQINDFDYDGILDDDFVIGFNSDNGTEHTFAIHSHARELENFVGWTQSQLAEIRTHLDRIAISIDGMLSLTDYTLDPRSSTCVRNDSDNELDQMYGKPLRDFIVGFAMGSGAGDIIVTRKQLIDSCSFPISEEQLTSTLETLSDFAINSRICQGDGKPCWDSERLYLYLIGSFRVTPRDWSVLSDLDLTGIEMQNRNLTGVVSLSRAVGDSARRLLAYCQESFEWTSVQIESELPSVPEPPDSRSLTQKDSLAQRRADQSVTFVADNENEAMSCKQEPHSQVTEKNEKLLSFAAAQWAENSKLSCPDVVVRFNRRPGARDKATGTALRSALRRLHVSVSDAQTDPNLVLEALAKRSF